MKCLSQHCCRSRGLFRALHWFWCVWKEDEFPHCETAKEFLCGLFLSWTIKIVCLRWSKLAMGFPNPHFTLEQISNLFSENGCFKNMMCIFRIISNKSKLLQCMGRQYNKWIQLIYLFILTYLLQTHLIGVAWKTSTLFQAHTTHTCNPSTQDWR